MLQLYNEVSVIKQNTSLWKHGQDVLKRRFSEEDSQVTIDRQKGTWLSDSEKYKLNPHIQYQQSG
jgi:hypothetical protein